MITVGQIVINLGGTWYGTVLYLGAGALAQLAKACLLWVGHIGSWVHVRPVSAPQSTGTNSPEHPRATEYKTRIRIQHEVFSVDGDLRK